MISDSRFRKRLIAGIIGIGFAVLYGFWTLLLTGGGHVNFVWFWLFLTVEFCGLYFPLMAVLAVDLRGIFLKAIYGSLIGFNLIVSIVMIADWVTEEGTDRASNFERTVNVNGFSSVLMFGFFHFLPTIVFSIFLLRVIKSGEPARDGDRLTEIRLS
jgi:hypothetical protein